MHDDTLPDDVQPRKRRKGIYILPNLFTLAALFGGFYSVVMAMNARFEPEFQVEMLRAVVDGPARAPDFLVYANRLFDPLREFEAKVGVAYGGPALSARNLECLRMARAAAARGPEDGGFSRPLPPVSATGEQTPASRTGNEQIQAVTARA